MAGYACIFALLTLNKNAIFNRKSQKTRNGAPFWVLGFIYIKVPRKTRVRTPMRLKEWDIGKVMAIMITGQDGNGDQRLVARNLQPFLLFQNRKERIETMFKGCLRIPMIACPIFSIKGRLRISFKVTRLYKLSVRFFHHNLCLTI